MPTEQLIKSGTSLTWDNAATDYALSFGGIAANDGQQGAKGDLGATRAKKYRVRLTVDPNVAPTKGKVVEVYWAASENATAADDNPGGCTGADAAYTTPDLLPHLEFIGALVLDDSTDDQVADVGVLIDPLRYGMPVVYSHSDQDLNATEGNQKLELFPIIDEAQ